jgi:MSHA biogenesis protein MshP
MTNRSRTIRMQTPQRGMALIAAIFLIVVLAALGMFAIRIGGAQQQTINLGLLGDRAVAAANTGIEYAAYQATQQGVCKGWPKFTLNQEALNGFTVKVTCTSPSAGVFTYVSTASSGVYGSSDYVYRQVTR